MSLAEVAQEREKNELSIIGRAREKIGKVMKPHQLINYCLNPARSVDRFDLSNHAQMKENELGVFVIDKSGSHIGVMNGAEGTIIHASQRNGKSIVVEEKIQDAKVEFPSGWRKIGPDGILKEKYQFKKELKDILSNGGRGSAQNSHIKPAPLPKDCPDCDKKKNGDL